MIDHVVIDRLQRGVPVEIHADERDEYIVALIEVGMTQVQIAEAVGCNSRYVTRVVGKIRSMV